MDFSEKILYWYAENKRILPWRESIDPYRIWLSEVMLQQTRVAQGLPYYEKFILEFPTIQDLANASEERILKLWQGLGYYSRARNMHETAKLIVNDHDGVFPNTYNDLLKLKGIGDYTASAIASICFNIPEPVVDGNVYRVLSRYFGIDLPINGTSGIKYFKQLARQVMNSTNVRDYNQGIMEFGAIQCAPKKPYCLHCPLNTSCTALKQNRIHELPVKLRKTKVKNRHFNYLVSFDKKGKTILEQRKGKGIWQNLYQFPLIESKTPIDLHKTSDEVVEKEGFKNIQSVSLYNEKPIVHKLSHQHLYTKFWIIEMDDEIDGGIFWNDVTKYAVPVLIADFIKTFKF
ncbi:MAG: A/G-specific adenine glycosylase [Bacteroidota bacterium]